MTSKQTFLALRLCAVLLVACTPKALPEKTPERQPETTPPTRDVPGPVGPQDKPAPAQVRPTLTLDAPASVLQVRHDGRG